MDAEAYNARVDFINGASRQLERKLAEENQKLHEFLRADVNSKSPSQIGTRNGTPVPNQATHYETKSESRGNPIDDAGHKALLVNGQQKHQQEAHCHNSRVDNFRHHNFWMPATKLVSKEGPVKRTIPPEPGSYGAEVTIWQWTKASERTAASGKPRF